MDERDAKALLAGYGLRVPAGVVIRSGAPAATVSDSIDQLTAPFAVKLLSEDGLHKSDVGGVRLGVRGIAGVMAAMQEIAHSAATHAISVDRFLIEEMAPAGVELVIGGFVDPRFGPCIMVGLGGVAVELFEDVAFRVCPIGADDAEAMLGELKSAPLLDGYRGRPPVSRPAIVAALQAIGGADGLLMARPDEIAEIDINPLIVSETGAIAADARIILATVPSIGTVARQLSPLNGVEIMDAFAPLLQPRSIAVVGASSSGSGPGNEFIRRTRRYGYDGRIVPIHPTAPEVEGLATSASLAALDEPVDFAYVSVGATAAVAALEDAHGKVRFAQVMSSGFSEQEDGAALERRLVENARRAGMRLLGPNCLGCHSPRGRVTFVGDALAELGPVGFASQSGGLSVDVISRGQNKGVRFSGVFTIGNSADLGPADFLELFLADDETRVIAFYLEDVKDGWRFFQRLREAKGAKPVILLLGGQTDQGSRAARSHTGSLALDIRLWRGVAAETGAVIVETVDQLVDAMLTLQMLEPRWQTPTRRVVLFGNGGGTSVLASDAFARVGLEVSPLGDQSRRKLEALGLPAGSSLANPIDVPAGSLRRRDGAFAGEILDIVMRETPPDALVVHVNLPVFAAYSDQRTDVVAGILNEVVRVRELAKRRTHVVLVLRSDASSGIDERRRQDRQKALLVGIPVFDELAEAAYALAALATVERRLCSRSRGGL